MPLGWHITVSRRKSEGLSPAGFGEEHGSKLAVWQTGLGGLDWLDKLVDDGRAIYLGSNGGYPTEYSARAGDVIPQIQEGPPFARKVWARDEGDFVTSGWLGKTTLFPEIIENCRPEEWLIIRAWDES